ncbi:MAG: glycerol-3-phosphate dehydrogenase [Povalibacter sp.]
MNSHNTANEPVDLLIVGGGINGVGIARDAAGRGHKVFLAEQADLASATSSSSTKLIHGGLRYLEQFEFRLVHEALVERERLLAIAPHIIRPMQFILPHVPGLRARWQIRIGLFLYDHIAGRRRLPASKAVKLNVSPFAGTLKQQIRNGFSYADCWVDDSRLVVLNAMDAAQRGATIRTRTKFIDATVENDLWHVRLHDEIGGHTYNVVARSLVNATGPWVEDVLHRLPGIHNRAQIRLVKGSHILVPRLYDGDHAFLLQNPDGRVIFTIPYEQKFTLIGTTDVPCEEPAAEATISKAEVEYLCGAVNEVFERPISAADIKWTYSGVRPLSDDDTANASKVTRDYKLELSAEDGMPPLLSVFGGKITTYRRLAESVIHKLHSHIGGPKQAWTDQAPLPGGDLPHDDFEAFLRGVRRRWPFLPETLATRLARAYGTRISDIVGAARSLEDLGLHFGAGLTRAEVDYLRSHEWALTADDILWRRTKLGLHLSTDERAELARYVGEPATRDHLLNVGSG